ncbi:hypothetical protein Gotur_026844 [Gossypium turneri]
MKQSLQVIVLLILTTLITELLLKFWVLKAQWSKLLNLKRRHHREKQRLKENIKNSNYNLKRRQQRGK